MSEGAEHKISSRSAKPCLIGVYLLKRCRPSREALEGIFRRTPGRRVVVRGGQAEAAHQEIRESMCDADALVNGRLDLRVPIFSNLHAARA